MFDVKCVHFIVWKFIYRAYIVVAETRLEMRLFILKFKRLCLSQISYLKLFGKIKFEQRINKLSTSV